MVDVLLHAGTEHAELTWIVVASLLTLGLGLLLGIFSDRIRSLFVADPEDAPQRE